jgi:hypothetical protein
MQWSTIPTTLQRELFDTAGSLGEVPQTVALRGQIARFLHNYKDERQAAGLDPIPVTNPPTTKGKPDGS